MEGLGRSRGRARGIPVQLPAGRGAHSIAQSQIDQSNIVKRNTDDEIGNSFKNAM